MKNTRIFLVLILGTLFIAGCGKDNTETMEQQPKQESQSELIRAEGFDVASLDVNKDGRVYQCPMDYQVIADTLEECPVCKMDLEEYTVAEAQENLNSHYQHQ